MFCLQHVDFKLPMLFYYINIYVYVVDYLDQLFSDKHDEHIYIGFKAVHYNFTFFFY